MKIKPNIALSETGFLFNPMNGESFSTNALGVQIINMIKEGKTDDEIKMEILQKYLVDEDTFEKDYYDFMKLLNQYLLMEKDDQED
jgi:hypothetical protein